MLWPYPMINPWYGNAFYIWKKIHVGNYSLHLNYNQPALTLWSVVLWQTPLQILLFSLRLAFWGNRRRVGEIAPLDTHETKLMSRSSHSRRHLKLHMRTRYKVICFSSKSDRYWGIVVVLLFMTRYSSPSPDSKIHGSDMGPTWVLSAPDGPHVGPMNLAIRDTVSTLYWTEYHNQQMMKISMTLFYM